MIYNVFIFNLFCYFVSIFNIANALYLSLDVVDLKCVFICCRVKNYRLEVQFEKGEYYDVCKVTLIYM